MKKAAKITLIVSVILIVVISAGSYVVVKRTKKPSYNFIVAEKTNLVQEVSVTGRVKPAESVELSFEKSGKVFGIFVDVGDKVGEGKILIGLDDTELKAQFWQAEAQVESAEAQLQQYRAALEVQQAKLDELKRGTRPEEIQVAETKKENAQKALFDAEINLENVKNKADTDLANIYNDVEGILNDGYVKADDAVNKQIEELFSDNTSDNPKLTFLTSDNQAKIDAEWQRVVSRDTLKTFKSDIDNLSSVPSELDQSLTEAKNHLNVIKDFLTLVNDVLNKATNLTQSTVNTYKGYVNTARTNVNTALSNISDQKQAIAAQEALNQQNVSSAESQVNNARNALDSAQRELDLKKAGATSEEITAGEAQVAAAKANIVAQAAEVKRAKANLENIRVQLEKTVLLAPMSGIVTKQTAKVGEIISAQTAVISLISEADFEIETNVPEVDIAKVKIGDTAKITLDAYGPDVVFEAKVVAIDPAETIVEGVATYKTTLQFLREDARIKSGMTANIDILTAQKNDVISIPYRALIIRNGEKIVKILNDDGTIKEIKVEVGLRGSDGNMEITEGISEGDRVITFLEEQ